MTAYSNESRTGEESVPKMSREEWVQMKQAEREHAYQMISQEAELLSHDGERLQRVLDLMSRFSGYSVSNLLLLECQKPDARRLADIKTWNEERISIKKGETGIIILEPGKEFTRKDGSKGVYYNTKKVFDVSQTSLPFSMEPTVSRDEKLLFRAVINNAPCHFQHVNAEDLPEDRIVIYDHGNNTISAVNNMPFVSTFREMAMEVARAHLMKENYRGLTPFVAVCASYVICRRNGVDTGAFDFTELPEQLKTYSEEDIKAILGKIRDVSNTISRDMNRLFERDKAAPSRDAR